MGDASPFWKPLRQPIESVNVSLKIQLDLERHGGRTPHGVVTRVFQRWPAMTTVIWHSDRAGQVPVLAHRASGTGGPPATAGYCTRVTGRSRRLLSSAVHRLFDAGRFPRGPAYLGDHKSLVTTRWGGALVVDTRDTLMAPSLLLEGIWERDITNWLMGTLRKGDVFVDVGANIGYYTLLARRLVGESGRVVAVEAHPELGALLRRNLLMNGIRDVHIVEKAAWSETAVVDFHLRTHFGVNSSVGSLGYEQLKVHADEETTVQVAAVPLDEVLADLPRVDVLKLDIEGSELHALRGLERTIQRNPSLVMMIEWCPGQLEMVGGAPVELVELLQHWGFGFKIFELGLRAVPAHELLALPYANLVLSRSSERVHQPHG